MEQSWLEPFTKAVGREVLYLKGNTSCSRNPLVALGFALDKEPGSKIPVLFMKCFQNRFGVEGMMMNSEAYSAYPHEGEFLLMEGIPFYILGIDNDVPVDNKY